ncbi:hypothetical protein [Brevundimonas halotolerans]|uniref:DUF3768 domain-containing protein n=1 Tax=Brevundimonas halotolerans TaxID=69670 RepID=A0A7W9E6Y7_9CAUL|nr:hypothetical protein [Brevundimonas halotolerans]MBB5660366.1 hypothetical protein [Brevundimonas halotolerans]
MLTLTDRASVTSALTNPDLDPDLRTLIGDRASSLRENTKLFVVQGGDTPEVINAALGFAITGDQAEEPNYSWIKDHGRWFEITYLCRRTVVLVENDPGTELGIHYLCLAHFWPDDEEPGR